MPAERLERLREQLGDDEACLLAAVLADLAEAAAVVLREDLVGVYLTGSFALGSGDLHSDVDFLVVTRKGPDASQAAGLRDLHRVLPDREEHWAHHLEGSYAGLADLGGRADASTPWLYVDNGRRDMEWSVHDNTELSRWVLYHRALAVHGPPAATLLPDVPPRILRDEAAALALARRRDLAADPEYLQNAWGQPHEVLTRCRLLFTATTAEVAGKADAAHWCRGVVPEEWHDLIDHAVAVRRNPTRRVHQRADPALASRTWDFVEFMTPLVVHAAGA
jgi:predicted nucleotidyltransferase